MPAASQLENDVTILRFGQAGGIDRLKQRGIHRLNPR